MQTYLFNTPVAIAISETILRLAGDFANQKNVEGLGSLSDLVADLIADMPDTYVSFIDLQHYLWQVLDTLKRGEAPLESEAVQRELKAFRDNLSEARESYRKLVDADSAFGQLVPSGKKA